MNCIDCEHFIGGGDWGLCCSEKYGLCYPSTEACEKFSHVKEGVRKTYIQYKTQLECPWCHSLLKINGLLPKKGMKLICPKCNHAVEVRLEYD